MGGRAAGRACVAYGTHSVRRVRAYDLLSDLYNTDSYFRDCVTHQDQPKQLSSRASLDIVRGQGDNLVGFGSPSLREQATGIG